MMDLIILISITRCQLKKNNKTRLRSLQLLRGFTQRQIRMGFLLV
jgi:hypothetical protein